MRVFNHRWVVRLGVLLALPLLAVAQAPPPRLNVAAREVPLPENISPELRRIVARPIPPPTPMPASADGWRAVQKQMDGQAAEVARQAAVMFGAKVEPVAVAGVNCFRITPRVVAPEHADVLLVHVHGGAYVFNGGLAATAEGVLLADACRMAVLSVDYRMPPDHPFPAAPDDVLAVWRTLLAKHSPKRLVMGGTSAGAGLIMTTMLRCKAEKLPMPAALFLGTPGADLSKSGDSIYLNAEVDNALGRYEGRAAECIKLYANGRDLKDPLLSPLYGDMTGWPPTILVTGTRDLLLSATALTHRKLRAAGVPAELHVFEGMAHATYLAAYNAPEGRDALAEIAAFFRKHLKA